MRVWNVNDKVKIKLEQEIESNKKMIKLVKNTETIKMYKNNIIRLQNAINFKVLVGGINEEGLYLINY